MSALEIHTIPPSLIFCMFCFCFSETAFYLVAGTSPYSSCSPGLNLQQFFCLSLPILGRQAQAALNYSKRDIRSSTSAILHAQLGDGGHATKPCKQTNKTKTQTQPASVALSTRSQRNDQGSPAAQPEAVPYNQNGEFIHTLWDCSGLVCVPGGINSQSKALGPEKKTSN